MTVQTGSSHGATAMAVETRGEAVARMRVLTDMATKLAATEEQIAATMADAAAVFPHRADHLLALADEARRSAAVWRAWAVDNKRSSTSPAARPHAGRGRSGAARVAHARQRLDDEVRRLHEVRLRYVQSLEDSAAAHDRAADALQQALRTRAGRAGYGRRAEEHRAAAAADRDRARQTRETLGS